MHAHQIPHATQSDKERVLKKALIRVADKLELSRREIGAIIGISEASLSRLYDDKRSIDPHSKEGELALMLLRLFRSLDTLFGGNEAQCRLWFRNQNSHLGNTPAELVQSVQGLITVIIYLDGMRGKI